MSPARSLSLCALALAVASLRAAAPARAQSVDEPRFASLRSIDAPHAEAPPAIEAVSAPEVPPNEPLAPPPDRRLVIYLGLGLGAQYDSRACSTGGRSSSIGGTCLLFAGGVDLGLLYRGRVGALLGLYSVSGVAGAIDEQAGVVIPSIPDRVSLPLLLDLRPLAFLPQAQGPGYLASFLRGAALGVGPSLEIVRTSSDQAAGVGAQLRLALEVPLHAQLQHRVALRFAAHLTYAPLVSLNNGSVRSADFQPCTDPGCPTLSDHFHGYGPVAQTYLGLVYSP